MIRSNDTTASPEHPILVLDNSNRKWEHHSWGVFTNPIRKTAFEFQVEGGGTVSADILKVDARFVSLLKWLGESHINVRLSGSNEADGYAVYKIREIAFGGGTKLSAEDGMSFLLSSHNMLEIEYVSDRVGIMAHGKIMAVGTIDELKRRYEAANLEEVLERVVTSDEVR